MPFIRQQELDKIQARLKSAGELRDFYYGLYSDEMKAHAALRREHKALRERLEEAEKAHADLANAAHADAPPAEDTRRETLEAVIKAFDLTEYVDNTYTRAFVTPIPGHQRLWEDITAALDLKEEQKRTRAREAAAKRLKDAANPPATITFGEDTVGLIADRIQSYGSAQTIDKPAKKKGGKK